VLWEMPNADFPRLSGLLPRMASEEVQRNWTGSSGRQLLMQTAQFVRSMVFNYTQISGRPLRDARVLDFGCGYGRIMRLLYRYLDEHQLVGVDPWDTSVRICREDGLNNVELSEYLPEHLPVSGKFDLIFAFSVFTHTSKRATIQALRTLRNYVADDGVLAITVRPVEYWAFNHADIAAEKRADHARDGFAFCPHNRAAVDGDVTYGDTSLTADWLAEHCPQWSLAAEDRTMHDPYQQYLFLVPA
jgi:SAM-dependent methyltransferase